MTAGRIEAEYVLPLRWEDDTDLPELVEYLRELAGMIYVTVVDGSREEVFARHAVSFPPGVRHLPPEPWPGRNGKVAGVMTGVRLARHEDIVLADDDVRYGREKLARIVGLLDKAHVVCPQNVFDPVPWHAAWDTGRTLLNRAFGHDFAGTMAIRRSSLLDAGGYDGDVLFENLELTRTTAARGGRVLHADDLFVTRRPPTVRHFLRQRVRQAYDDFAQPGRLVVELAVLPAAGAAAWRRKELLPIGIAAVVALAGIGRLRGGGRSVFPPIAPFWAPLWLAERSVCVWLALASRVRGGVRYSGGRISRAATPLRRLRARHRESPPPPEARPAGGPDH
ncbi:glycosyltransferase [Leifsonia sp. AG29]|uniref:glycosyltransferase n=1 Tax=Leifsonia sp. AG29 TaxID=2598860 RepID=UPI001E4A18C7|nr:glycosyltransferase family 2 protein [Leifsonia sp. AG29]